MTKNVYWSSCNVPVISVRFELKFNALNRFLKNTQISNLTNICSVEAKLLHANGRTDMSKLIVAFRNFENAPKNVFIFL